MRLQFHIGFLLLLQASLTDDQLVISDHCCRSSVSSSASSHKLRDETSCSADLDSSRSTPLTGLKSSPIQPSHSTELHRAAALYTVWVS